jgi:hypothetical protein
MHHTIVRTLQNRLHPFQIEQYVRIRCRLAQCSGFHCNNSVQARMRTKVDVLTNKPTN